MKPAVTPAGAETPAAVEAPEKSERRLRRNAVTAVLAYLLVIGAVAWGLDLFRAAGLYLYSEQFLAAMLAIAIPLTFLSVPAAARWRVRTPIWDYALAFVGFGCAVYVCVTYPELSLQTTRRPIEGLLVGSAMLLLIGECVRRTVGLTILLVAVAFFLVALLGSHFPASIQGRSLSLSQLTYYLAWDNSGLIGTPLRIVVTVVITFVLFGNLLFRTGGGAFFTDIAMSLMGRYRGGAAKIGILASSLFGSISGSVVSNVVTTGVVTIPMMRKSGLNREQAGAIEAVASTGGQLMPPIMGAAAFLMAEFLGMPYRDLALAALVPALLFYLALFLQADLQAARQNIAAVEPSLIPRLSVVLRQGWVFLLPFVVLIGTMFGLNYIPERAAVLASVAVIVGGLFVAYGGSRLSLRSVAKAVEETGYGALDIVMIGAAAGVVIGALNLSGIGFGLTMNLAIIASNHVFVLLVIAALLSIVLGMGMPTVGVYVLLATLVVPALMEAGVAPLAAHMFVLYFGMMSMVTPPIAIGAFAAAAISGGSPMRTGWEAMRFSWLAFVIPFLFVLSPTLLLQGDAVAVAISIVTAVIGVVCISVAMVGYLIGPVPVGYRVLTIVAGAALLLPAHNDWVYSVNVAGGLIAAAVLAVHVRATRAERVRQC